MQRLYTPWRLEYLKSHRDDASCLFCDVAGARKDKDNLVLYRGSTSFVIINLYPYSTGHLMVVPNRHLGRLTAATAAERGELMDTLALCERILMESYSPDGMNMGLNLGRAAGAGILGHLHFHLVPRWSGDTNFTTAIGNTRIIPETPDQTYARLADGFARAQRGATP
jgi:ATP adenylyltransferase